MLIPNICWYCVKVYNVHVPFPGAVPEDLLRFFGGSSATADGNPAWISILFIFTSGPTTGRGSTSTVEKKQNNTKHFEIPSKFIQVSSTTANKSSCSFYTLLTKVLLAHVRAPEEPTGVEHCAMYNVTDQSFSQILILHVMYMYHSSPLFI